MKQQPQFIGPPIPAHELRKGRKSEDLGCETCTLNLRLEYKCDSFGDPKSRIWWVGEAPGKNEVEVKPHEPFVGVSGQFHWDQVWKTIHLLKSQCYTGNAARCWPEDNRTPTLSEVKHCLPYLEAEIRQYRPVVIGALGAVPFHALTGLKDPISEVVGQEFIRKDGVKVIPLYHPSYLLRLGKPEAMVKLYQTHLKRVLAASKDKRRTDFAHASGYKVELLNAKRWVQYIEFIVRKIGWCSIDIETKEGKVPYMISSAYGTKRGVVAYWDEVKNLLPRIFMLDEIGFVFQNGAGFDIPVIEKHAQCKIKNYLWDTFIAGVTLDSRKGKNNLTRLTEWAVPDLAGYDGVVNRLVDELGCKDDYSKIPSELLIPYAGYDAISCALIYRKQEPLANIPLVQFYMELMREVLTPLEQTGMKVDIVFLDKMISYLQNEVELTREKIISIAGDKEFNPGSTPQVSKLLFEKLKLPLRGIRRSKITKVPAVDRETFTILAGKHPVIDYIQKLRSDEKSLTTYAKRVKNQLVKDRFHVKYWIGGASKEDEERGAETGRLSSTLQNVPRVDKDNPRKFEPADIFIPDKGMVLLVPDYCLTGDTEIVTEHGNMPIREVIDRLPGVLSVTKEGKPEFNKVLAGGRVCFTDVYEVLLEDGSKVRCTSEHKWRLHSSSGYVTTKQLRCGSRLAHVKVGSAGKYPTWYLGSAFKYVYQHRMLAHYLFGQTPLGFEVDHKDGNSSQCVTGNIRLLEIGKNRGQGARRWWNKASKEQRVEKLQRLRDKHPGVVGANNPMWGHGLHPCAFCGADVRQGWKKYCNRKCYFAAGNHKVVSVMPVGKDWVYQITVDKNHNYVLANGLVSKNSQAELRMVAILAHEQGMISDFKRGVDAHDAVCHRYLEVPEGVKPSKTVRVKAKGINFAKIFGAGVNKLSQQIGCTVEEIYDLFKRDQQAYPNYWRWRKWQIDKAARDRCVYTLFGFRRPLDIPDIWDYKEFELEHWQKQALNTPVQGSAAQIMLLAQLIIKRMNLPCIMLGNLHDSAPMEVYPRHLEKVAERVKYAMEVAVVEEVWKRFKRDISVLPWVAEMEYGERFSRLKELKLVA